MKCLAIVGFILSFNAWGSHSDCDLDGHYVEETQFFSFGVNRSRITTTGKVSYNEQTFFYSFPHPLFWSPRYQACATTGYFQVAYWGAFGRVYYCNYPVTTYLRKKIQSNEYVSGTIRPTEIQPGPGCYSLGNTESKYTVLRHP